MEEPWTYPKKYIAQRGNHYWYIDETGDLNGPWGSLKEAETALKLHILWLKKGVKDAPSSV